MEPSTKQELKAKTKAWMGIISDKTAVGMAKIRGEEAGAMDVAILKATLQDDNVPKEKHVRTLKIACSGNSPRGQVNYVIHGLGKRFEGKPGWLVTLKTLIVFHRLMRETDISFQEEMLKYAERTGMHRLLRMETFADHTTKETWDFSAWIRVYSVYLDERLAVFRAIKFDPEVEGNVETRESKLKSCSAAELLEQLPLVQKLLGKLVACVPEGSAQRNEVVLLACQLVLRELRAIYKAVCEGIINLADKFFEMERNDATKGLELYRENIALNDKLNTFFSAINNVQALKGVVQFPNLQSLPSDFLTTLEEYVRDAPKIVDANAPAAKAKTTGPPPTMTRASTLAARGGVTSAAISGGTHLVVGPPVIDTPKSAEPSPTRPAPAPVVDLLDFGSASLSDTPAPVASAQPAQPANPFDDLFGGNAFPATPAPAATSTLAPPAVHGFGDNAFGAPAPAPVPAPAMIPNPFGPPPSLAAPPASLPVYPVASAPTPAPMPFGVPPVAPAALPVASIPPTAPPAIAPAPAHAAVMPPPAVMSNGFGDNAFGAAPATAPPVSVFGALPTEPAAVNPFATFPAAVPPASNPFGVPAPAGLASNPFAAQGPAPMPVGSNPFAAPSYGAPVASNNPFASPQGAGWPLPGPNAAAPMVVSQQMGGYTLKKPAEQFFDLGADLFGKPAAAPAPVPMREHKQGGSPGNHL